MVRIKAIEPADFIQEEVCKAICEMCVGGYDEVRCRARSAQLKKVQGLLPKMAQARPESGLDCLVCAEFSGQGQILALA